MATRRVIKSALWNFLGAYVSRYSDYTGYWLFGFVVDSLATLRINLLDPTAGDPNPPIRVAVQSAVAKFKDQCGKAGLAPSQIQEAWLTLRKLPGSVNGPVNGRSSVGCNLSFTAVAVMDDGRRYEKELTVFVAPHNAKVEARSARDTTAG